MRSADELPGWVEVHGGAVRAADARAAGFTTHGIRSAVAAGDVFRVRKNWLLTDRADPSVRRAVAHGGRLTCLTEASRLGLWLPPATGGGREMLHIAVPPTASRLGGEDLVVHWASGPAPVGRWTLADPILNVLFHVARCLPREEALIVWESAIRGAHVGADTLREVRWGSDAARSLSALAADLSDSGLETRFVSLMRTLGLTVRQQVWIDGHRVDGVIGDRLVVQLDGFAYHTGAARRRDLEQDARLVLRGYTVLRFDFVQVFLHPQRVLDIVGAAVAQGRHLVARRR